MNDIASYGELLLEVGDASMTLALHSGPMGTLPKSVHILLIVTS